MTGALAWTRERFGEIQANRYLDTIRAAIRELHGGPEILGTKDRSEIAPGLRSLHIGRNGRRGRHVLLFRVEGPDIIDILRLLHDSMDFARHLPEAGGDET